MADKPVYEIVKDIPMPDARRAGRPPANLKYPLREMEVGDMIRVPINGGDHKQQRLILGSTVSYFGRRNGRKYAVRKLDDAFGVWRLL